MKRNKGKILFGKKEMISWIQNIFPDFNKSQIESLLDSFLSGIKQNILDGKCVSFFNYFTIWSEMSKPRTAINMKTKEKMIISPRLVPKWKFSGNFKSEIEKNGKVDEN